MSIPPLSTEDLEHAAAIVQRVYSSTNAEDQQVAQRQLFELQQRIEAWNIILPFLQHDDPNLQFIGAHTAQVKIARDWDTLPKDDVEAFRQSLLNMMGYAATNRRTKIILRKLYVALISLALRLTATNPPQWPNWVVSSVGELSSLGLSPENLLDYLAIVAEEAHRSDLAGSARVQLTTSVRKAAPVVCQAAGESLSNPSTPLSEKLAALRCVEAWSQQLPGEQLGQIIPILLNSLSHPDLFVNASDVISELMTSSALGAGAGTRILTDPLLQWVENEGKEIFQSSVETESIDDVARGLCKMLVAVGDHSLTYIMKNINTSPVLAYLEIVLGFTGFPGWYGVDEFESDMTTSFWVYFSEAILDSDWNGDESNAMMRTAHDILVQLVAVLQRKCSWPPQEELRGWTKDQKDTFVTYRRDAGESMLNAFYVLRNETLSILLDPVISAINSSNPESVDWEEVEAALHCVDCCQDAVPLSKNSHLEQLIEILPKIPTAGHLRLRQTAINLIGDYSTWFTDQPTPLLLGALTFVVAGLPDKVLCLSAAGALKQLCDANRTNLAPHIASFGEILSSSTAIPNTERAKVIESIASVIEALPPAQGIAPVLAIAQPVIQEWSNALQAVSQYPEEARVLVEQQIRLVSACSKGLSPAQDAFTYEEPDTPEGTKRITAMDEARADPALADTRLAMVNLLRDTMSYWSSDSELSDAISDLMRSITSLPLEVTLISLPPAPLLELVCLAASRQLTAIWLTLVSRLVVQLQPPSFLSLKAEAGGDTKELVDQAAQSIIVSSMRVLQVPGVMEENPDLVQAFFSCMESIAHTFLRSIMVMPAELANALMECASRAISLQERYSLVSGCKFLVAFVKRSASDDTAHEAAQQLLAAHAQNITDAIVNGIAGDAPRSAVPNLAAVLSALVSKLPSESRGWLQQSMLNPRLAANTRATPQAKEAFLKTISASRSSQRTITAANDFSLIARGLSGTSYAAGQVL